MIKSSLYSKNGKTLQSGITHLYVLMFFFAMNLLPVSGTFAQKDSLKTKIVLKDNSPVVPRYPNAKHIEEFRNDSDYQYNDDPQPPGNPLAKWINWLFGKLAKLFSGKAYESFWQYVFMAAAAGLVLFLLYKAKVLEYVFPSKNVQIAQDYVVGQENIHELNFEEAISNALEQRDFRLAIRLQYLKILKLLTTRELIHWKPNLTNQSYVQELEKYPYHADFVKITRYFEFAWYGDFQIEESGFKEMKDFSNAFQEKIIG